MRKNPVHPPGVWGLLTREWERALRSENKSPNTIYAYIQAVRLFGEWANEQDPVVEPTDVRPAHIRDFIAGLIERTSPGNAHTTYRGLRTFFKWLVGEEELDRNPMDHTKPPFVPEQPIPVLPDGAVTALLDTCKGKDFHAHRDTALIRVLDDTGARRGEVAGLGLDDVDFDIDVIQVMGKGRRKRAIPFGPKTGQALTRYLRARASHKYADDPHLWLGDRGPLGDEGIKQMLTRRGDAAGIDGLHPHLFRHTLAHNWQVNGGNETDLMRIMGWRSAEMLRRYGASAGVERAHRSHRRLNLGNRI